MSSQTIPDDLRYTPEHEWVRPTPDGALRLGITDYAQQALGDVVYVSLPERGARVSAGDPIGEVESTKSVADVFAPVSGEVVARNETVGDNPEAINTAPYGDGWLVELRPDDPAQLESLLDAARYRALVASAEA